MIRAIQRFFETHIAQPQSSSEADTQHALHLATAALFIEMTRADFEVKQEERRMVTEAVQRVLDLQPEETAELIALADQEARESVSLFAFTHLVNRGFLPEQKKEVIELMWRIAFADSEVEKHEEHLVRKVARLIHVPHKDFIDAKRRARLAHRRDSGTD